MSVEPTTTPAASADAGQQVAVTAPAVTADKPVDTKAAEKPAEPAANAQAVASLVRREQEIAKEKQAIAKERAEIKEQLALAEKHRQLLASIEADPLAAAEAIGLNYDALTQRKIERARATISPDDLKKELDARDAAARKAQEEAQAAAQRREQEAAAAEVQRAQADYMTEARSLIDSAPDEYELLRDHATAFGAEKAEVLVWNLAKEHFAAERAKNPKARAPSAKEAVAIAEAALLDRAKKIASVKKLGLNQQEKPKPPVSLSNEIGASSTGRVDKSGVSVDAPPGSIDWMRARYRELEHQSKK